RGGATRGERSRSLVRRDARQAFGLLGALALLIATFGVAVGVAVGTGVVVPTHAAAASPANPDPSAVVPNSQIQNYQNLIFGPNDDGSYPCNPAGTVSEPV